MVQKRPLGDEKSCEGSSKHPRQLDYTNQLVSLLQFVGTEDMAQPPNIPGEVLGSFKGVDEKHACGITSELPILTKKDSTNEQENGAEAPFQLLLTTEYCNSDRHIRRTLVHFEETFGSQLESPPQKLVPIGPAFQADLPEWGAQGATNASYSSGGSEPFTLSPRALELNLSENNNLENKLAGICVIPLPESGMFANNDDEVGNGRTDCNCVDFDSVRCVRQHIQEARDNLWSTIGQERFLELGFYDMGEVVADKWTQEEELLFRECVFSYPISSGNNFWDYLLTVFPLRTKRDIVSYYFNVFVLQKRSLQNRHDPMNIDSDDDEWMGIVDSGYDNSLSDEEDGDSLVESGACYADPCARNEILDDSGESEERVPCEGFSDCENVKFDCDMGTINSNSKGHLGSFIGTSGGDCHEYVLEHCETKIWDVGCGTWPKNEVEFLPTCSMIEELFGLGSLSYMSGDGKGLS